MYALATLSAFQDTKFMVYFVRSLTTGDSWSTISILFCFSVSIFFHAFRYEIKDLWSKPFLFSFLFLFFFSGIILLEPPFPMFQEFNPLFRGRMSFKKKNAVYTVLLTRLCFVPWEKYWRINSFNLSCFNTAYMLLLFKQLQKTKSCS